MPGSFAGEERPVDAAMIHVVEQGQVEPAAGLLIPRQHQAFSGGVTPAAIGLHRDGLDIEVSQDGAAGSVVPPHVQAMQDHTPIGIGVEELTSQ